MNITDIIKYMQRFSTLFCKIELSVYQTNFTCTNFAKPELFGEPLYSAMEAPFSSDA
jgi:hypothetical protein